ncbi:MAG: methyl-accepting chemotaxis protein [Oscillospiraceae bacterium]|jgi:methyl-accepting chemotaxis protein|nr:methyl-accepting chemotaxis protein [Oscillospiraceae bacterium]
MKNLKVSVKLVVSFLIVVALMLAMAVFAITQMYTIKDNFTVAIDNPLTVRESIRAFQVNFRDLRIAMWTVVAYTGVNPEECEAQYISGVAAFESALASLDDAEEAIVSNPKMTQEEKAPRVAKLGDIRALANQYRSAALDPMQAAMRTNDQSQALAVATSASALTASVRDNAGQMLQTSVTTSDEYIAASNSASSLAVILMIAIAFVAVVISITLALYISKLISRPLLLLTSFMKKAGETGDITLSQSDIETIGACAKIRDEIGQCISACAAFVKHVTDASNTLEILSGKDLTVKANILSDKDVIGNALGRVVGDLNGMLTEIHSSTAQVASGSKQIADGSQSLAQGSTQQAAAVEQLSSSITEIAQKTKDNADMASKAASLAGTIKTNAEKGSRQMDEMMAAVKEINQASQSINKVIKVIDDIAFQTNILSLNAAVEAARAGQHGKGFAVVAEEVRGLAAKSAEAAKDTEGLIANSMAKAELGSRIANDTAASLADIVSGINESSQIVTEIAKSSEEQSLGIAQINRGIDQVAQVVQQNSATAEESAAAAEEMSGQSAMLEELISQFKLKDGTRRGALPAPKTLQMPGKTAYVPAERADFGKY